MTVPAASLANDTCDALPQCMLASNDNEIQAPDVYDAENRLAEVSTPAPPSVLYSFDPLDRRVQENAEGAVTQFLYSGAQEIAEYDGLGNLIRRFVPGAGFGEVVATVAATGGRLYHHADALGSTVARSDETGAMVERYAYGPFGEEAGAPGGTPFRYTGQRFDAETGLYQYRARAYSPALGRFLQPDPIGTEGGINLYAYVENDPVNLTDPLGLHSIDVNVFFVGGTIGIGDNSGQAFAIFRYGLIGAGVTYNPSAEVPRGSSGEPPGDCTSCDISRVYWETERASVGGSLGPINLSILEKQGATLVNEFDRTGSLISSIKTPGTATIFDPNISVSGTGRIGLSVDVGYYREIGTTIPWATVNNSVGRARSAINAGSAGAAGFVPRSPTPISSSSRSGK